MTGNSIFITGTDTGVGKTLVAALSARYLDERGVRAITQKWVQTGCEGAAEDVLFHMRSLRDGPRHLRMFHSDMAPYVFRHPSSPHLAARLEKKTIDPEVIKSAYERLMTEFEFVVVEGTGGLLVPLNDEKTIADIVEELSLPVLIVADNRLGAINQTLLTARALEERGIKAAGIVFNRPSGKGDELILEDNPRIVGKLTGVNVLGDLPFGEDLDELYEEFIPIGEKIFS